MRLAGALVTTLLLVTVDCTGGDEQEASATTTQSAYSFSGPPIVVDRPLERRVDDALSSLLPQAAVGVLDPEVLNVVADSRDARLGWLVSDLLRFYQGSAEERRLVSAFRRLTGVDVRRDPHFSEGAWRVVTDHLIAWDLPAPPSYRERKAQLYVALESGWKPFFADADSDIDWRRVAWGGVLLDDRRLGDPNPCARGCIPALDDPALTEADGGAWYPDERIVFGVVVGGEAVAFPKNIMEVHELVNITIGSRRVGIPYQRLPNRSRRFAVRVCRLDAAVERRRSRSGADPVRPEGRHARRHREGDEHDQHVRPRPRRHRVRSVPQASNGATPFGFAFDKRGHLIVSEAFGGTASALSSYDVGRDGLLDTISPSVYAAQEQASCWVVVTRDGKYAYTTNIATGSISAYEIGRDGTLSLLDADGLTAVTGGAPIDAALSRNSRFLYVLNASLNRIDAFRVESDGGLTPLAGAGVTGLPAGANGLVSV